VATSSVNSKRMSSARPTVGATRGGRRFAPGKLAVPLARLRQLTVDRDIGATKQLPRPVRLAHPRLIPRAFR
jgi:hypothetical protein